MEEIRYEKDMYEPVKKYLGDSGFDVRSELNKCDVVARKDGFILVVEMKRHLSFDLLEQAVERESYSDAVYVCIPKPVSFKQNRGWRSKIKVLKRLGLGLFLVSKIGPVYTVEEALSPEPAGGIRTSAKKRKALDHEFDNRRMDLNTGGTHKVPLVTAYRESALFLVHLLDRHGPLSPKDLRSHGALPPRTTPVLRANHYGWFVKNTDGTYGLTDCGREALALYSPLIDAFRATGEDE